MTAGTQFQMFDSAHTALTPPCLGLYESGSAAIQYTKARLADINILQVKSYVMSTHMHVLASKIKPAQHVLSELVMSSTSGSGSEASISDFDDDGANELHHKVGKSSGVVKRPTRSRARSGTASAKKLARKTPLCNRLLTTTMHF